MSPSRLASSFLNSASACSSRVNGVGGAEGRGSDDGCCGGADGVGVAEVSFGDDEFHHQPMVNAIGESGILEKERVKERRSRIRLERKKAILPPRPAVTGRVGDGRPRR